MTLTINYNLARRVWNLIPGLLVCAPTLAGAQEGPEGALSFGISHSSYYGTMGSVDLSVDDLWLEGLSFDARLQSGEAGEGADVRLSYGWNVETSLLGEAAWGYTGLELSYKDWDPDTYSVASYTTRVGLLTQLAPQWELRTELVATHTELSHFDTDVSPFLLADIGDSTSAGLRFGLQYDSRENEMLLAPGTNGMLNVYAPFLGDSDRNYVRLDAAFGYTVPVHNRVTLKLDVVGGVVMSDDSDSLHVLDRAFSAQGLPRGFDFGGAGPRDVGTNTALGGARYTAASAEVLMPINERNWTAGVFYDIGNTWDVPGVESADVTEDRFNRSSYGVSLNVPTGIGDLRITYAEPDRALDTDELNNLSFSLNSQF